MLKIKILFLLFVVVFFAVIIKLFYIQVLNSHSYSGDYLQTKKIYPTRGKIFDIHGQPLAVNETKYLLYVEPKKVEKKNYLIKDIDNILHLGEATIEARIDDQKDWVRVTSGVTKENKEAIVRLNIPGVGFQEEEDAYYPESSLSAHLVGFVGKNTEGQNIGYVGVEGYYEKELAGLPGLVKSEKDLIGRPIFFGIQNKVDPQNGGDLILTVDNAVQTIVKKKLASAIELYKAKDGCVIMADPYSMKIISLVCLPDFDPENYYKFGEDFFKNSAISDLFEPGSIFKPLIMAAAIESKAVKPDEIFNETGPVNIADSTIKTWNDKYEGKITMTRILEKSSNVGMVYVGGKLGNERLYNYIQKYQFGKPTQIDLQGEVSGYLRPKDQWYPIDFSTVTFGQGIAITPIQMLRAFASIINGGNLYQPYVVDSIVADGIERKQQPKLVGRVVSERTSEIMKKMLESTVENGEIKWLKPIGYTIGGKTGTAQIPIKGQYDPYKTNASFIGFAPVDKPKFIAMVILREPQSSQWGSETAAPLFFDIAKDVLLYYNIAPEGQK